MRDQHQMGKNFIFHYQALPGIDICITNLGRNRNEKRIFDFFGLPGKL